MSTLPNVYGAEMEAEISFPTPQGQVPGHRAHVTRQNTAEAMCVSIHTENQQPFFYVLLFSTLPLSYQSQSHGGEQEKWTLGQMPCVAVRPPGWLIHSLGSPFVAFV